MGILDVYELLKKDLSKEVIICSFTYVELALLATALEKVDVRPADKMDKKIVESIGKDILLLKAKINRIVEGKNAIRE